MIKLIGFAGFAGAGKTTAAKYLGEKHGYIRTSFATPIKDMLQILGLDTAHLSGHLKHTPTVLLGGKTPREAMQTLGTEWGRNLVHPDLWVEQWTDAAREHLGARRRVVVDDVRFENEVRAIEELGGKVLYLATSRYFDPPQAVHPSESPPAGLHDIVIADDIAEMKAQLDRVIGAA